MHHSQFDAQPKSTIERWLTGHLLEGQASDARQALSALAHHTPAVRLSLLNDVLKTHPILASAAARLSAFEQLELNLELLQLSTRRRRVEPVQSTGCSGRGKIRHRAR